MNRIKLTEMKVAEVVNNAAAMNFPDFLKSLRKAHAVGRRVVNHDIGFSEMRLFWLEGGYFKNDIPNSDLSLLAEYYGVPMTLLLAKYQVFKAL